MTTPMLKVAQSNDVAAICSIAIPQGMLYKWYIESKKDTMTVNMYAKKLASAPMPLLINTSCRDLEERLRVRAQKIAAQIKSSKAKADEIKQKEFAFKLYNEDILQPSQQLSNLETQHRYVYNTIFHTSN